MHSSARPQTSRNRDRAVARLQSITTRTAIVASIATVGFGGLAAYTYSGTTGANDTTAAAGASVDGTTTDTTKSGTSATARTGTSAGLQPAAAPTATKKPRARVTSGGSGH